MGTTIYFGVVFAIIFASFAMLFQQGLWSNTLTFLNVCISGLLSYGLMVTAWSILVYFNPTYFFVFPLLSFWLVFVVAFVTLNRGLTGTLSKTHMRFNSQLDTAGGGFMAFMVGLVLCSYSLSTMHYAALPVKMLGEKFMYDPREKEIYEQPDLAWIKMAMIAGKQDRWGTDELDRASSLVGGSLETGFVGFGAILRFGLQNQKDLRVDIEKENVRTSRIFDNF